MIAVVTWSARAAWTSGLSATGATVSTYCSVSETTVLAHTETTDNGASTQATTMSTLAPSALSREPRSTESRSPEADTCAASSSATRARSRATSSASFITDPPFVRRSCCPTLCHAVGGGITLAG